MGNNQSKFAFVMYISAQERKILEEFKYVSNKVLKPTSVRRRLTTMTYSLVLGK